MSESTPDTLGSALFTNYYALLGVRPNATRDEIKSAYRDRVKSLHPDRFDGGSEPFLALQQAYEVLCDPVRRRRYDSRLARTRGTPRTTWRLRAEPLRSRRSSIEPLIPHTRRPTPIEPLSSSEVRSDIREPHRRLWREREGPSLHRSAGDAGVHIEVSLTRTQALRGGSFLLRIPLQIVCSTCDGRGTLGFLDCPQCDGAGVRTDSTSIEAAYPAGVTDGDTDRIRLRREGADDVDLTLYYRVLNRG